MYEVVVTFLDAILSPRDYQELLEGDSEWNWDKETRIKAQGMKASLCNFQTITTFVITKNILDEVKPLASKFQKREIDIVEAYEMVDDVLKGIRQMRETVNDNFTQWYEEILRLSESVGTQECLPRRAGIQRHRSNIPCDTPQEHYTRVTAIPLLDSLLNQMCNRFSPDNRQAQGLLSLIPSVLLEKNTTANTIVEGEKI